MVCIFSNIAISLQVTIHILDKNIAAYQSRKTMSLHHNIEDRKVGFANKPSSLLLLAFMVFTLNAYTLIF